MVMQPGAHSLVMLCAVPSMLLGQTSGRVLKEGDRVRISAKADSGIFIVKAVSPDTLTVQLPPSKALIAFPVSALRRVDISRGNENKGGRMGRHAMAGLMLGAAAGGLIGLASSDDPPSTSTDGFRLTSSKGDKTAIAVVGLGGAGLLIGLMSSLGSGEHWERVPLPPRVSMTTRSDGMLALSYSF
jgi:hypothetical protein